MPPLAALHHPKAIDVLQQGGIIAYPTEAVYGLGCDPFNPQAVSKLLQLKRRHIAKGLIVIAGSECQLSPYLPTMEAESLALLKRCWPGPHTWLIPNQGTIPLPHWISGAHSSIAWRVPGHAIARALCLAFGGPMVSTSANKSGQKPAKTALEVRCRLGRDVDYIVPGAVGSSSQVSTIRDLTTGRLIR